MNPNLPAQEESIDIMPYIKTLLDNWKLLFKIGCIASVVALILVIDLPKKYPTTAILAPEIAQKSGSNLSSLAAIAGINISNAVMTDAMYPDIYPEIVNSIPFNVELLSMPVSFERKDETIETDLYTYLKEYQKGSWWGYVISAPGKALGWLIDLIKGEEEEDALAGAAVLDPDRLTRKQTSLLKKFKEDISISVEKKTFLITISVKMQDPEISKQLCDKIVENLQKYVTQYRTEKSRRDVVYYTKLNQESRESYYAIQQKYAAYVDGNQGISRHSFNIEKERMQNETNLAFSLYNQTSQQLQMAQAKLQQETPVCVVVQPATVPIKGYPSRAKNLLVLVFLAEFVAAAWILFGDIAKKYLDDLRN